MSGAAGAKTPPEHPLTLFAIPRAFQGHIGVIQRNAIASWTRMNPRPEILLFGTDPGTAEMALELGVRHVPEVERNRWGTPLVSDLFGKAQALAENPTLCYVNADIVLFDDFVQAVTRVAAWGNRFLMVGRRTDIEITSPLAFQDEDWRQRLRRQVEAEGKLQIARSIDYFAFSRGLYPVMPPLAIGRFHWDNWLLWKARSLDAAVVDASPMVLAVHQNHDYSHARYGPRKLDMMASEESILNARLTCEQNPADYDEGLFWRYAYTIDDATWKLTHDGIRRNSRALWKTFKRYSSRPLGLARLTKRALFPARAVKEKNVIAGNQR
ncbi:MAG TPA: hypothetical protein VEI01_07240 [Terriglobales bacterium]|nr:hypothetical protein [Terriglobales bacterium]